MSSSKFALVHDEDKRILLNSEFAQKLAKKLEDKKIFAGTILLHTEEIELDPAYVFSYNNPSEVKFPGRYDITIVADRFDLRGGKNRFKWR